MDAMMTLHTSMRRIPSALFLLLISACAVATPRSEQVVRIDVVSLRSKCNDDATACLVLNVTNRSKSILKFPTDSDHKDAYLAEDYYTYQEAQPGSSESWSDIPLAIVENAPPEYFIAVPPNSSRKILVYFPEGLSGVSQPSIFRVTISDQNKTKFFSSPFDSQGNALKDP